ncbi:cysteine desulfurase [Pseudohoeflea suaedae]|uniref:Cysteine desulfurase n=1 Tax=Pseudohoeflea suaedae TaxID=877384 RepID=A0A4R5PPT5_9HYPH|nr:cysteine desulfurase family protein [Pseudohoeflea suaedae]TDH39112.1 cysteine desulfurase [Pseudohoeflea suaedae]
MDRQRAYLDYNATAPLLPAAREAMVAALDMPGNPSSVHAEGRAAREVVARAREAVARLCGAAPANVILTSGATEAACHVLTPDYRMGRASVRIETLFIGATEHPCVLRGGRFPAEAVRTLAVDADGVIDLEAARTAIAGRGEGQFMLALQLANSETGVVQPVRRMADIVHSAGGVMVVDAVQAAGRLPIDIEALGADFLFVSAHKIGGPKGIGALVSRGETFMPAPLIHGGGQEKSHRAGTENLPGIAGFGAAAEAAIEALPAMPDLASRRDMLEAWMRQTAPDVVFHGARVERLANTSYVSLPGLKAETAQIAFDMEGVAVSAGSACSSGKVGVSHVLKAMGADADLGAVRISLGPGTQQEDVIAFQKAFEKLNARRLSRLAGQNAA